MVDASGRIKDTSVRVMSKLLLSFTYIYPEFKIENCPRINVIFTDFSVYPTKNKKRGV